MSLHIAPEERLTVFTQRKRNGQPRRPTHSMTSILLNVHLLLRVPSFARWPLKLHFFDKEVHQKWGRHCASAGVGPLPKTLEVVTDFKPAAAAEPPATSSKIKPTILDEDLSEDDDDDGGEEEDGDGTGNEEGQKGQPPAGPSWGIHALPLDHAPLTAYLEKGQSITVFEREGGCVVCHEALDHDKGIYAICSQGECEGVGHLDCWSGHLLRQRREDEDDGSVILPTEGRCPACGGAVRWGDMMRELTLRMRGQKEVDKLLRKSRRAAGATKAATKAKTKTRAKDTAASPAKSRARGKGKGKATSAGEEDE